MPKLLQNKGDGITMMGTLHAKEDNSQYPIMDTPNHNRNNANSSRDGLWGVDTQGEYTNPAQPEERFDASGGASQRVHAIISGENMTCVHALADDSTWQDATHKTARRGELVDGGGTAGTLPPSSSNSNPSRRQSFFYDQQPHNIDLHGSLLEGSINSYCLSEQMYFTSYNPDAPLHNSMTDAIINGEFCYGNSSIIGASISNASISNASKTRVRAGTGDEQPYLKGCTDAIINGEFCYGNNSIIGASISNASISNAHTSNASTSNASKTRVRAGTGDEQPYLKGCTDAIINGEFCYGNSSIIGASISNASISNAHTSNASTSNASTSNASTIGASTSNASTGNASNPQPPRRQGINLRSTDNVSSAYATVSSSSLHNTLSKVLSSYMASTDAHGNLASNHHAQGLARNIEASLKGRTLTVDA